MLNTAAGRPPPRAGRPIDSRRGAATQKPRPACTGPLSSFAGPRPPPPPPLSSLWAKYDSVAFVTMAAVPVIAKTRASSPSANPSLPILFMSSLQSKQSFDAKGPTPSVHGRHSIGPHSAMIEYPIGPSPGDVRLHTRGVKSHHSSKDDLLCRGATKPCRWRIGGHAAIGSWKRPPQCASQVTWLSVAQ